MFSLFRKKEEPAPAADSFALPPDLEKFRSAGYDAEMPERERKFRAFAREMEDEGSESAPIPEKGDAEKKIDMILQKLETIDLRLRVIEQKMERRAL